MSRERWWSWNADLPAEMRHLSSGFIVTPLLYASSVNRASRLTPGPEVVFGARPIDESEVALELALAGTRLAWRYGIAEVDALEIAWRTLAFGEWGLRFWVLLCLHAEREAAFRYDPATGVLEGTAQGGKLDVRADKAPLLVTFHPGLEDLEAELVAKGYFYLGSRGREGRFAALRFNLEEAPEMRVRLALGKAAPRPAAEPARPPPHTAPSSVEAGDVQRALLAMHDVISWNHVFDFVNRRPYTALSRFWNSGKFGGFGVWLNDVLYNAWLWSHFDPARALENLDAVFAWQTEAGNFPCLVTGNDAWLDRSQPPIAAFAVWTLAARTARPELLARYFPGLLRNYRWWWARRRLGETGLVCYGTSLDAGDGLYKGTKLAAKNESSMDNSPVHDPAPFDPRSGLLHAADVGLNSLLALDGEILATMAAALGRADDERELRDRVAAHKARIAAWLWDEARGVYANRLHDGRFVAPLAPTSFYPLVAGIGPADRVAALVDGYLLDERKFGGRLGLPSVTRDDPAYADNVYWRGRIWPPLNFWVYQGLRRAGRAAEAAALAAKGRELFAAGWKARECGENYNAETGAIHDQPDTDGFYSWGALLPALAVAEHLDVTPWAGWSVQAPPAGTRLGPVATPVGPCFLCAGAESWCLQHADGRVLIESNLDGRLSALSLDGPAPGALLPAIACEGAWIAFPAHDVASCRIGDRVVERHAGRFALPARGGPAHLTAVPPGVGA